MHLTKQTQALEKMKKYAKLIRVKNNRKSQKEKKRQFFQTMQPWQHGLVKVCTAIPLLFQDMKKKYGTKYLRTSKLNQVEKLNFILVLLRWVLKKKSLAKVIAILENCLF